MDVNVERMQQRPRAEPDPYRTKKPFPDQVPERQAFFARMRGAVAMHQAEWPFEHDCWQKRA